jgi:glycosyltransferase involved in cell wall biosynthesis
MKKSLTTSVIVPAYNAERTISETLRSLLDQTARDFEIVVVDDGSTDKTPEICHRFKENSPVPIRVFRQKNRRQSAARNLGIIKAEGEYVIFLDADDLAENEFVEKLVRAAETDPEIDISCCSYSLLFKDGSGKPRRLPTDPGKQTISGRESLISLLKETLEVWSGSALYRRNILLEKGVLYDENMTMGQDIDFRWRAFYHARKVALVPDLLVYYVQHDHSVTRAFDPVRYPPSTWIDPSLFQRYIENHNDKDERLRYVVQNMVVPRFLLRRLRLYVFYGLSSLFWQTLQRAEIRAVLKRGFKEMAFRSPGISLKCLSFLVTPRLMYHKYRIQRERIRS